MPPTRNKSIEEQRATLMSLIPQSGEIEYTELYDKVVATGNKDALTHVMPLKYAGVLKLRTDATAQPAKTYVSRKV